MINYKFFITASLLATPLFALAQSANAPFSETYYHWIDRWEIQSGVQQDLFHNTFKAYQREHIGSFLLNADSLDLTRAEQNVLSYLKLDNWEWVDNADYQSDKPILRHFYRAKSDFFHVRTEDFDLHVNPIVNFQLGQDVENEINTFTNTRGIRLRGVVDNKVAFYTSLTENQVRLPLYISQNVNDTTALPHVGFYKSFNEDGYDFFDARGYISFNASRHINLQFGHDNFKIGNGYRSMMLSDFGPAYLFFKMETKVWKINYTNLFTEMTARRLPNIGQGSGFPDKYGMFHHLSIDIGKKWNVGLFEAVIVGGVGDQDATFELEYLNPIIFYRAIEQQNGSSYNAVVGADFQWLPFKGVSLYGQLVFDEFLLDNLREGNGWWANKFGIQFGGEWINAFNIPMLDLQGEVNLARPYTFSHNNTNNSYSHYNQPLAHPFGANFNEVVLIARFQPVKNLFAEAKLISATQGLDPQGENWGGNILISNRSRVQEFNNEIGQGITQDLLLGIFQASYMLKHNLFVDASLTYRRTEADNAAFSGSTTWLNAGVRWNIFPQPYEF